VLHASKAPPSSSGTRAPVQALIDYLKSGDRLDDFLDDFPTVQRERVEAALDVAGEAMAETSLRSACRADAEKATVYWGTTAQTRL
jgi:uncharacterized protein (DUF433 family)